LKALRFSGRSRIRCRTCPSSEILTSSLIY
jgi:hypothetical protein